MALGEWSQRVNHFYPLCVVSLAAETSEAKVITLDVPDIWAERFRFQPGQHLIIRALLDGAEVRRAYSICSACNEPLRVVVKRVAEGRFSAWVHDRLQVGEVVECMPPRGRFCGPLTPAVARHHVAFAAGSGIGPVFSIIKTVLATEPESSFTLLYGNGTSSSIIFREALLELKDRYPIRFSLQFMLSREPSDVALWHGRIDRAKCDALLAKWLDTRRIDAAYLCGPSGMMDAVYESLVGHGVEAAKIHQERFANRQRVSSNAVPVRAGGVCRITVIQDGLARQFSTLVRDQTVLDMALEHGMDPPYACKAGVCATCRCRVLSGEVAQRDPFALERDEIAQGFILACQSVPISHELTIDYDF